uniref:Uncharacterized protein n=1 Tax=Arundo donax TaxID=35708 RepID=A0A0A9G9V1_ARUDO
MREAYHATARCIVWTNGPQILADLAGPAPSRRPVRLRSEGQWHGSGNTVQASVPHRPAQTPKPVHLLLPPRLRRGATHCRDPLLRAGATTGPCASPCCSPSPAYGSSTCLSSEPKARGVKRTERAEVRRGREGS